MIYFIILVISNNKNAALRFLSHAISIILLLYMKFVILVSLMTVANIADVNLANN